MTRPFSLYVHVPYCARKCPYCDFNTYAVDRVPESEYVDALLREMRRYAEVSEFSGRGISTVFFGGGTPSLLSGDAIASILREADELYGIAANAEVTVEANPSLASGAKFEAFSEVGVNRLSFGAQSFSSRVLELLGRDHRADEISNAIRLAREAGIDNLSIDLIYGVPQQTVNELEEDLAAALTLPVLHVSTYLLSIEKGTPFFQRQERGLLALPAEEVLEAMLERVPAILESRGFRRYEISNYAKPGRESKHNMSYWRGSDYLGLGAGAHSYAVDRVAAVPESARRWSNLALPAEYIRATDNRLPVSWSERLDRKGLEFEFFYLGLRRIDGVDLKEFEQRFGVPVDEHRIEQLKQLEEDGFLTSHASHVKFTAKGIALSDSVFEYLAG